jgi:hypothetical protein
MHLSNIEPPTSWDFVRAYYSVHETYLPEVELSKSEFSRHLLCDSDNRTAQKVQDLLFNPNVEKILNAPMIVTPENLRAKTKMLLDLHFESRDRVWLLDENLNRVKDLSPTALQHSELPNFCICPSGVTLGWHPTPRVSSSFHLERNAGVIVTQETPWFSILMSERIRTIAQANGIKAILPVQKVVKPPPKNPSTGYCVVSQEIDGLLSREGTIAAIRSMTPQKQKMVADNLSRLIEASGFLHVDFATIRLTRNHEIAFWFTPSMGLFSLPRMTNYNTRPSVEKCGSIGLAKLMKESENIEGLTAFYEEVKIHYTRATTYHISIKKIILTILSVGVIFIIQLFRAYINTKLAERELRACKELLSKFQKLKRGKISDATREEGRNCISRVNDAVRIFLQRIEGIPYPIRIPRKSQRAAT